MNNSIKCKNCGAEIEVSEALTHQIEEQVLASLEIKHKKELEDATKLAEENAGKKAEKEFKDQLAALQTEKDEEKERNKKLTGQISELLDEVKKLRVKDEERNIEMKTIFGLILIAVLAAGAPVACCALLLPARG